MTNSKTTKRALLSSGISLLLCFAMLIGTTFAWFTDSVTSMNNVIKSGNLDVNLYYWDNSMWNNEKNVKLPDVSLATDEGKNLKLFRNADGEEILWEPGATGFGQFEVANEGTLALKYELMLNFDDEGSDDKTLADVLSVYARAIIKGNTPMADPYLEDLRVNYGDSTIPGCEAQPLKNFELKGYLLPGESFRYELGAFWEPSDKDNEYNVKGGLSIDFGVTLVATQMTYEKDSYGDDYDENAEYPEIEADVWDGTVDTSWYNDTDTEFKLNSAEQLAGLAKLVDGGNTFEGKTVVLASDADLYCMGDNGEPVSFDPIGDKSPFKGTFDGNGHTISNLYQSGWAFNYEWGKYGSIGLFGELESATIKNVTISGAEAKIEGGDIGGITGSASGNCVFENITIKDSDFGTYNNGIGGIIGWSGAGNYTFKNIRIGDDVVLGGLWGSFDSSIGGVVGQGEPGATYNFENVDIACRLDAYNDVTAAYKYYIYRMCGMLIGRLQETTTIDGKNYPDMSKYNIKCKNVNVTYGDWVDYHYCVVAGKTAWRVESGYAYGGIPADHDHSTCAMHCNLLLPFDSLFGGAQYGVNGITSYDGVTVVYNNK